MGEADFVLLHPKHGLLVIEVKDGRYRVEGRRWIAERLYGTEVALGSSPFEQAVENRYQLVNWIKDQVGVGSVPSGHCVVFTDGRPSGNLGPDAPEAITLTGASFGDPVGAIMDVVRHWARGGWRRPNDFAIVLSALSPDVVVAPSLDYDLDVSSAELERLTTQQIALTSRQLAALRETSGQRNSLVLGAAGTGKTVIAHAHAREVAKRHGAVAVVGLQPQLRLVTRKALTAQGIVSGDPSDVLRALYGADRVAMREGEGLWATVVQLVEEYGPRLDCLIVDEAQSLHDDVLDAVRELVIGDGEILLLADPYQRDPSGSWRPRGDYNTYWLTENCRNTLPIAKLVARVSGAPPPVAGAHGRRPILTVDPVVDLTKISFAIKIDIDGVPSSKVVVLTRTARTVTKLQAALRREGIRVSSTTRDGYVTVCTVDDYRGCEAHAVLYLAEPTSEVDTRTTDYIAVSRACAYLHVFGAGGEWAPYEYTFEERARQ